MIDSNQTSGVAKRARPLIHVRRLRLAPLTWIGAVMLGAVLFAAAFAPLLTRYDPVKTDLINSLQLPSVAHPLGTDNFGRDILSRLLYAARVDLQIMTVPTTASFIIGLSIGSLAGYYGGAVDGILMRIVDVSMAFPFYVLVIAIVAMLGPGGLGKVYVAMVVAGWVAYARVIRGEVLAAKNFEYILGARALGASDLRVIRRHLLPNVVTVGIIFAMSDAVLNILLGGALSFLGLGVQPPTPEWGLMIAEGRDFLLTSPAMILFPGLALLWVGVTFNLLGDALTDHLRPGG
jgi:peptide/nickel transport system permease protein